MFLFYKRVFSLYLYLRTKNIRTKSFELRLKLARSNKGHSKNDLANLITVHYSQSGRYENRGVHFF